MQWLDSRAEVLGVQLQPPQGTETAHRAEGRVALQAENPGTDATDAGNQSGTSAEGTCGLLKGLEELLRLLSDASDTAKPRLLDTPPLAIHDLEAMEAWSSAVQRASTTGRKRGPGGQDRRQRTRSLALG